MLKEAICETNQGTILVTPRIIENAAVINKHIQKRAIRRANEECKNIFIDRVELGVGPLNCGDVSIFAHDGPIDPHKDDAGYTYGLVLYAEEDRFLVTQDKELPLKAGTVFLIDSDQTHSAKGYGLIIFATCDFFYHDGRIKKMPTMPLEDFAPWAMKAIREYL